MQAYDAGRTESRRGPLLMLCAVAALLFAILLVYSRTIAFAWDEGFHLLAAQLILAGKRPYLDFCYPQAPLYAYWNALWMGLFGDTWRVAHAVSAVVTAGAILLAAEFLVARFPVAGWRLACAVAAALAAGLNATVVGYGAIGQAYGLCLFLLVAAFRVSVAAVERASPLWSAAAGFFAGAAVGSSLLTAAAAPVLLVWIPLHNRAGNRGAKLAAYLAGAAVPFLPLLWLFARSPHAVFFNLVLYQLRYRRVNWEDATAHDLAVLTSWLVSSQPLLLALLAALGLRFIARMSGWDRAKRAEFYLCAWLALAIGAELCATHPTFERYFILVTPFLAILAAVGFHAAASRLYHPVRPMVPLAALALLLTVPLAKSVYQETAALSWRDLEAVARKIEEVTPPGGILWGDEHFHFLTRRPPPEGVEFSYAQVIDMPAAQAAPLHIVNLDELVRQATAGAFATVATCEAEPEIQQMGLAQLYLHQAKIKSCTVFWDRAPARQ
ncbi:MAG: hypothetical protein LAP87_12705 [Acidobacteriia bacterium]|nr:hypothetical protein [Terriglobia bacterium]